MGRHERISPAGAASVLDEVWAEINALGGTVAADDEHGRGKVEAIDAVLEILERRGATDPAIRRAIARDLEEDYLATAAACLGGTA